jgi:hypothetical protein
MERVCVYPTLSIINLSIALDDRKPGKSGGSPCNEDTNGRDRRTVHGANGLNVDDDVKLS